jgi:DNA polymerase-1
LQTVAQAIDESTTVTVDTETTGLDPRQDRVRLLSLGTDRGIYILDCSRVNPRPLFELLAQRPLILHNAAFDLAFLAQLGFEPGPVCCTMLLSMVLHGTRRPRGFHTLRASVERELARALDKTQQTSDWSGALTAEQLAYAADDVEVLRPLHDALLTQIQQAGLEQAAFAEFEALPAVAWLASSGVAFDAAAWSALSTEAKSEVDELRRQLDALAPPCPGELPDIGGWNWDSPQQVTQALAAAGVAAADTLDSTLAGLDHPLAALLRQYRGKAKLASTYGPDWLESVTPGGRIHAGWKQLGATTGRMACSKPNLQNLPRATRYRRCFVAPPGRVLVKGDYSQIELRVAARIAGEERMIAAYRRGEDLHTLTAQQLTGRQEVTKQERQLAKPVNFGIIYGLGAPSLRKKAATEYGVVMTPEQAREYRDAFLRAWPGIARWHGRLRQDRSTETRTLSGRRVLVKADTWYGARANYAVQGTAGDGLKLALGLLWERRALCPGAFPVLVVHDEIVVEADAGQSDAAAAWLRQAMLDGMAPLIDPVPVEVEVSVAQTWGGD